MVHLSHALALVAVVAVVATQVDANRRCPWALGKYPFDESKLVGQWYILAGTPLLGESLSKCPKFTLSSQKEGSELVLNLKLNALSPVDGTPFGYESISQAYKPEKASLSVGVWRKQGSEQWTGVYKQSIVATDYDKYAVFLACRPVFNETSKTFERHLAAQIWGRSKSLGQETLDTLINLLTGYDVDRDSIQIADQSCGDAR